MMCSEVKPYYFILLSCDPNLRRAKIKKFDIESGCFRRIFYTVLAIIITIIMNVLVNNTLSLLEKNKVMR